MGTSARQLFIFLALFHIELGIAKLTFKCTDSALELPIMKVCDHVWDCPDGSDESPHHNCRLMSPSESVVINSPGWPDKYPNNANVTWSFGASRGLPLLLNIVSFNLEQSDFLVIGGGPQARDVRTVLAYRYGYDKYTRRPYEMYANLTGNDIVLTKTVWRSEVSQMWMFFGSDSVGVADGFKMILSTPAVCDEHWRYFDGSCYRLVDTVMRHGDAATYCSQNSGHLVVIQSEEENDFVAMVAESRRGWIGASRRLRNNKEFSWVDHGIHGEDKLAYTNWRKSEPNNYSGRENCVEINYVRKGLWNDHFCLKKKPFVCEASAEL